jgi:PKD repeat protein
MSQFTAYQTQQITFTDTSSGGVPPLSRLWSFPGGNITSATGATAQVTYGSPGTYTVTLTVTDDNGITNSLVDNEVLNILPGFVTSSFTKNVTVALMSQPLVFTSTSTGLPSAPNSYGWKYAGQSDTNPIWNFDFIVLFGDWQNIPGANINDAPGTQINFNVSLSTSFAPFTATSSQLLPARKIGALENFYLNTTDGGSLPYQNFILIELFNDGTNPYLSGDVGYSGETLIYKLTAPDPDNIVNFHSDQELCQIVCTGFLPTSDGITSVSGYLMVTDLIYASSQPIIQVGQYILNSVLSPPVTELYISGDNELTSLYDNYNWDLSLFNEIFSYPFPVTHSAQQYSLDLSFPSSGLSRGNVDPMVPSPRFLESLGAGEYNIYVEVIYESSGTFTSEIIFNANDGDGNEKTGVGISVNFYVAQDTSGGDGIVTTVNNFLSVDLPGGTGDIIFEAGPQYSVMPDASPSDYNGIIMKILNPDINSVVITDNSETLSSLTGTIIPPFAVNLENLPENGITCTGILSRIELSPYKEDGYSRVNIGGSLF